MSPVKLTSIRHLAFSRIGGLAQLVSDGRRISLRTVARNQLTGEWALTDESQYAVNAPEDVTFTHIEWSNSGLDLVILDLFGRIYIHSIGYAVGRLHAQPTSFSNPGDDLGAVVGTHFLPIYPMHQRTAYIPAITRNDTDWSGRLKMQEAVFPHNPQEGRIAFFALSRSNLLRLVFQQENLPWGECSIDLGEGANTGDLLTHAAFGDGPDFFLLATCDFAKRLRLYKIRVQWSTQSRPGHQPIIRAESTQLTVEHLDSIDHCMAQGPSEVASMVPFQAISRTQLSNLYILPSAPASKNEQDTYQVLALLTSVDTSYLTQPVSTSCSVLARWSIVQQVTTLHESFKSLKNGSSKTSPPETSTMLRRLNDIVVPKIILGAARCNFDTMLAFPTSDGSVDFRHLDDLELVLADDDNTKAASLPQVGFAYLPTDKCVETTLTTSACMAASVRADGSVGLSVMDYLPGWMEAKLDDYQTQAALVCVAREFAAVTALNNGPDEILALIPPSIDQKLRRFLIGHVFRTLSKSADLTGEDAQKQSHRVMRDNLLHRILAGHLVLTDGGPTAEPDVPHKTVWIILNLRLVCTSIATTVAITSKEPAGPEAFTSMRHATRWAIDLLIMILDDLFEVYRALDGSLSPLDALRTLQDSATPSMHLLLCSSSRALLRFVCELLKMYYAKLSQTRPETVEQKTILREMMQMSQTLPFRISYFDALLQEVDSGIRHSYQQADANPAQRTLHEHAMLIDGDISGPAIPAVENLLKNVVPKLMEAMDVSRIYFWKTEHLGLKSRPGRGRALQGNGERGYDVLRKCSLRPGTSVKKCRRCGSCMEDLQASDDSRRLRNLPLWEVTGSKFCVCMGHWMVE